MTKTKKNKQNIINCKRDMKGLKADELKSLRREKIASTKEYKRNKTTDAASDSKGDRGNKSLATNLCQIELNLVDQTDFIHEYRHRALDTNRNRSV